MPLPLLAAAGISLLPSAFKLFKGIGQGKDPVPVDPGYQINQAVVDNAKTLGDQYTNYQLPGYGQILNNLNSTYQSAFNNGSQGATSGGDLLDLAGRLAYGQGQQVNQLGIQAANAKQTALANYLNANAAAGQEYQNANAYERQKYQDALKARAAKQQASAQNIYGALDSIAGTATSLLTPRTAAAIPGVDTDNPQYQALLSNLNGQQATTNAMNGLNNTTNDFNKWLNFSSQGGNGFTFR